MPQTVRYWLPRTHEDRRAMFALLPSNKWHCVPFAVARARCKRPDDVHEVAREAAGAYQDLREQMNPEGCHFGSIRNIVGPCGLAPVVRIHEILPCDSTADRRWQAVRGRYRFPTVAQWLREHPRVTEAIIRITGHCGYYRDGVAYALEPRSRVDLVIVLRERALPMHTQVGGTA